MLFGAVCATDESKPSLTFACRADNDLYRAVAADAAYPRYDEPADAVNAADESSGVLVLADGYPDAATAVAPGVFETAARKRLRLYVEYPAMLPEMDIGAPRAARLERLVVASDFFGADLPKMRIAVAHGMRFVPISGKQPDRPHLVAAHVAGFDTAVFGLPKETYPILFECREGRVLAATTKLSNFAAGRYGPRDAWTAIWRGIFEWLRPGQAAPKLNWTPQVRPAFGPDDPLPPDVELQALRRGADWFVNSKLLLHPSRMDDVEKAMRAGGGAVRTPPADAPVGDGSLGILEGMMSVVHADGSQMQSVSRRGDCTGESAMALAFGGKLTHDKNQETIARNLLNFWYFTSDACKNERGDPKHGAYGLIAWGVGSPNWLVANYGDDNARLLLGTLAAAALLDEDRWDEAVMRCLLANLRTTGQLGFRGDRIDIPELSAKGWRPFFEQKIVSYTPHMEAYLWACYLWAYRQTGYELFRQRAENAIRMTMAEYTDGWRWTNGLAQERARMLLPLAWLVRVDDTPEHRRWLDKAVDGLLALQEPCGAIREELGRLDHGRYPPPKSNADYGKKEASLIQRNGDPVCDLLYTTNFAFLGLHEAAAATCDPRIRQAENRLAKFLCRIQIRSDAQPSLDGGWFRGFDFRRWEAWASNADVGWGAWSIESGWTQGWIVSVLAMRELHASLWDLTQSRKINASFPRLREEMSLP